MGDKTISPFRVAAAQRPATGGAPVDPRELDGSPLEQVARLVRSSDLFVFMKGTPEQPMCGFSANTVSMLDSLGARYATFDVLSNEAIRAAAKEYAQWPTFPRVWLRGELIGGNDIVTDLLASGELARMLEEAR